MVLGKTWEWIEQTEHFVSRGISRAKNQIVVFSGEKSAIGFILGYIKDKHDKICTNIKIVWEGETE